MKTLTYFAATLLLLCGVVSNGVASTLPQELVKLADEIVARYQDNGWFSGNVLIKKGEAIVYERSVGYADIPSKIKNTSDTKIRIGSINKHYTAVLVLQKVQQGELSLDDTLAKFELGFPKAIAEKITIRQLLQHRSGFADLFTQEYIDTYQSLVDINDKLPILMNSPLISEPGTEYHYSNYGYIVLGAVLEKLANKSFKALLHEKIFHAIGAKHTDYALTASVTNKARSYHHSDAGEKVDKTHILENVTPDGGMYATATDIALFYNRLFYSNALLDDEHKALLGNGYQDISRAWSEMLRSDKAVWSAYGGAPGVSAAAEVTIKEQFVIVVLANTDGQVAERISQELVAAVKDQ